MNNWKVEMTVGNNKEKKTIFVRDIETEEEVYSTAKIWFMTNNPKIVFWGVDKVTKL